MGKPLLPTDEKWPRLLRALAHGHSMNLACAMTQIGPDTVNKRIKNDPDFASQVEEAKERGKRFDAG